MNIYEIGTCSYCDDKKQILRPSPFMADTKAMMCEHCWNETKKEYLASNEEYIPDFDSNKSEYENLKNSKSNSKKLSEVIKEIEVKDGIDNYYVHHNYITGAWELNIEFHNDIADGILENNVEKFEDACAYWE